MSKWCLVIGIVLFSPWGVADNEERRDPTKPLSYSSGVRQKTEPKLSLQAVFLGGSRPSVVINGRSLHLGDRVAGWEVIDIRKGVARLSMSGRTKVLRVHRSVAKYQ